MIVSQARVPLIRRRKIVTQQHITVVVNNNGISTSLKTLQQAPTKRVKTTRIQTAKPANNQPQPQPQPQPQSIESVQVKRQSLPVRHDRAVSRNNRIKKSKSSSVRKKVNIRYLTTNPTQDSYQKIANLRSTGIGKVLVIVGNGPSINEVNLELLNGHNKIDIMSINKPDSRVWPTKFWTFFDQSQLNRHQSLWDNYDGIIFNSTSIKRQKNSSMQFKNHGGKGWSKNLLDHIYIGRSSVFASMQIAAWMKYDRVYIFGCDMNPDGIDGKLHFYGINPDVDPDIRRDRFDKEAEFYDNAANLLDSTERSMYYFCSAYNNHSFVNKFNKMNHREAVTNILNFVNNC